MYRALKMHLEGTPGLKKPLHWCSLHQVHVSVTLAPAQVHHTSSKAVAVHDAMAISAAGLEVTGVALPHQMLTAMHSAEPCPRMLSAFTAVGTCLLI